MNVNEIGPESLRPDAARRMADAARQENGPRPTAPVDRARPADQVEISEEGRAMAYGPDGVSEAGESLSPERASELRLRIADGTYDSPEMMEEVARRIVESGDLFQ